MAYIATRFVETSVFTRVLDRHLDDEAYRTLQLTLVLRPEQGVLIPGSGGLRKLRWATKARGKRGGLRLIYYWAPSEDAIYSLYLYSKTAVADLTKAQIRELGRVVRREFE